MAHPALFLDRDGTILVETGYLHTPADTRLIDGAAVAIQIANRHGWKVIVVSNQSGIARGYYPVDDYHAVTREMIRLLDCAGARIDGTYFSPYHPQGTVPEFATDHPDRKPGTGLIDRAVREHDIDIRASWMIGDKATDVQTAVNAGMAGGILVKTGYGDDPKQIDIVESLARAESDRGIFIDATLLDAVRRIETETGRG